MKKYVKQIEAIQFTGDILSVFDFIGPDNTFTGSGETGKHILTIGDKLWNVYKGDYIVKEYNGVVVYKESRFLKDYALESKPEVKEEKFVPKVHSTGTAPDVQKFGEIKTHESGTKEQIKEVEKAILDNKKSKEE